MRLKVTSCLVAISILFSVAGNSPVEAEAKRTINWKWSDTSKAGNRTFINGKNAAAYPVLIVTVKPREIARIVSIQYFNSYGIWQEENRAQTVDGEVRIQPDPYCAKAAKGDGCTLSGGRYRILIEPLGDQPQYKPSQFQLTWKYGGGSGSSGGSSSGSSGSGGGISAALFIGWNLEDVQDALGYDPPTVDCSGWGRSVWWSSNWWVVGVSGGTLIVSKSPSRCT